MFGWGDAPRMSFSCTTGNEHSRWPMSFLWSSPTPCSRVVIFPLDRFISCLGLKFLGTSGQNGTLTLKKSQLARRKCPWIPSSRGLQSLKHALNLGLIKQLFNNCWLKAYSWLSVWSWNSRSSFCLHFHLLFYLLPNSQCLFFGLHFHPLLHLLPNGQCLFFSKRILLITFYCKKRTCQRPLLPFLSQWWIHMPPPLNTRHMMNSDTCRVAFSHRLEIRPTQVLLDWGRSGLCMFPLHRTSSVRSSDLLSSWRIIEWYLTFMQSSAIHRTFSCQHK